MKTIVLFRHSFFFLFLLLSSCTTPQEDAGKNYNEIINDFSQWSSIDFESPMVSFKMDSSDVRPSTHFFQITPWGQRGKFRIHLSLHSKLLLPYRKKSPKNAKITFTCKSENLKPVKLVTSLFDEVENHIRSDTLFASTADSWNTCSKDISFKGGRFFNLELIAEGIDSTYQNNRGFIAPVDKTCNQNLWIDNIRIELDGIDIRRYTDSEILDPCRVNQKNIIPIENEDSFKHIPELKEKKIVAIGESIHGSEMFYELFYQMVKHQVLYNQCKLILLECNMSESLLFNSYIQGNETYHVDSLLYNIRYTTWSCQQLKNILLFLKDYNRSSEKKVTLMGFDSNYENVDNFPGYTISEYLYALNKSNNYSKIDTVCYELITTDMYKYDGSDLEKLETDIKFHQIIGETEFKLFSYCCHNTIEHYANPESQENPHFSREKWMFENTKYLIDLICGTEKDSKVLIHAHMSHLQKKQHIRNPFGYYMHNFYGDLYSTICLIAQEGSFFNYNNKHVLSIMPLKQEANSIESILSGFSEDCMYVPVQSLSAPHIKIRNTGNAYREDQFQIITPAICFDAIIYKKETEAAKHWPDVPGNRYDIVIADERRIKYFQKIHEKIKGYKNAASTKRLKNF